MPIHFDFTATDEQLTKFWTMIAKLANNEATELPDGWTRDDPRILAAIEIWNEQV